MVPEVERAEVRELIEPPYRIVYRMRAETIEALAVIHGFQEFRARP